jgi:hypothetical protein
LEYRIDQAKRGKKVKAINLPPDTNNVPHPEGEETPPPVVTDTALAALPPIEPSIIIDPTNDSSISSLTGNDSNSIQNSPETDQTKLQSTTIPTLLTNNNNNTNPKVINHGGRTKGSTDKAKRNKELKFKTSKIEAAFRCIDAKQAAKRNKKFVKNGTYKKIIYDIEEEFGIKHGKIRYEMIKSRIRSNNPTGTASQKISPLAKVEPLICEFCIQLARIGEALTKYEIFELADDLIRGSVHAEAYIKYCERRYIIKDWDRTIVGESWYRGFMLRNENKLKRAKCKVIDNNRRTYCTYENFSNMYDAVYENMVDAGVAIKLDHEVMFDK